MARYVNFTLEDGLALRPPADFRARHYNLERQVIELVNHAYVRYPVPIFLYRAVLSIEGIRLVFGVEMVPDSKTKKVVDWSYREWFMAAAQGRSFAKTCQKEMNRKEAHLFLQGRRDLTIRQNILWAKARASGFTENAFNHLLGNLDRYTLRRIGHRLPDMIRFVGGMFADYSEQQIRYVLVFLLDEAMFDPNFTFAGRTSKSVYELTTEYYRDVYLPSKYGRVFWSRMFDTKEFDNGVGGVIRFTELNSSAELQKEGKHQHHCVLTFLERCRQGKSKIVSARSIVHGTEIDRLTIEVDIAENRVIQVAGRMNRVTTHKEMQVVHRWARAQGLVTDADANWMVRGGWV